ncbi:hypothetical protein [uncultured Draconibacterium sp.]|uniref:hypothetical protein n=1 Tax=uncultured Draconibacterium sp. TaxID=1573823 RepID=UPI002AA8F79A|nr:hypothetical protein [uncultured Draconibacterium sp.]
MLLLNVSQTNFWDVLTAISSVIMAIGVFFAAVTYRSSRRSNQLQTIEKCSDEYRRYMKLIQRGKFNSFFKRDLLGLFHKQLFYIEFGFLPHDIKIEWLKTMHAILRNDALNRKYGKMYNFSLSYDNVDCQSFDRVKRFLKINDEKGITVKDQDNSSFIKPYKMNYLTWAQRKKLLWSKHTRLMWIEAFST